MQEIFQKFNVLIIFYCCSSQQSIPLQLNYLNSVPIQPQIDAIVCLFFLIIKTEITYKITLMNPTKTYLFFDSKSKKQKKPTQPTAANHSRSLSAKSDLTKNSARNKLASQKQQCLPITKKQKQIRQAIQYRFRKSKMRDFQVQYRVGRNRQNASRSHSSQMEQFKQMKMLKVVNLKQYHEKQVKKRLEQKQKNSLKSRLRIRTDSSLIMKTQGSERSIQKLKFLKSYLQPQLTPTKINSKIKPVGGSLGSKQDWKFISIQFKQKDRNKQKESKSKSREIKINSHRTLTVQKNEKVRTKTTQSQWQFVPKLKDLGKVNKKYRF